MLKEKDFEIVEKETVYYTIQFWKYKNFWGKTSKTVYINIEDALSVLYKIAIRGKCEYATIRENIVYVRNENTEISTSGIVASYEDGYSFIDLCV